MASFDFGKWHPSTSLRYAQDERCPWKPLPFVLSVAERQRSEVEGPLNRVAGNATGSEMVAVEE